MSYRLAKVGVIRLADGKTITRHDREAWRDYQAWRDAGNAPLPVLTETPPTPTRLERVERLRAKVQQHYDTTVRAASIFDGLTDALLHTGFASAVRADAIAIGQWEVACRVHIRQVRADVLADLREPPTAAELIAELPLLVMP